MIITFACTVITCWGNVCSVGTLQGRKYKSYFCNQHKVLSQKEIDILWIIPPWLSSVNWIRRVFVKWSFRHEVYIVLQTVTKDTITMRRSKRYNKCTCLFWIPSSPRCLRKRMTRQIPFIKNWRHYTQYSSHQRGSKCFLWAYVWSVIS